MGCSSGFSRRVYRRAWNRTLRNRRASSKIDGGLAFPPALHRMRYRLPALLSVIAVLPALGAESAPTYGEHIRPLLQAKCAKCHGEKVHKADLNLSSPAGIRKG